jgi:hypothetical protein
VLLLLLLLTLWWVGWLQGMGVEDEEGPLLTESSDEEDASPRLPLTLRVGDAVALAIDRCRRPPPVGEPPVDAVAGAAAAAPPPLLFVRGLFVAIAVLVKDGNLLSAAPPPPALLLPVAPGPALARRERPAGSTNAIRTMRTAGREHWRKEADTARGAYR